MSEKHSLSDKDTVALTATCSTCGEGAAIRKNGRYGYVCLIARRMRKKQWAQAHPDRARASRSSAPSPHRLENKDGGKDTCAICGPVQPVAWGRGWMCPTISKNWTNVASAPAPRCGRCNGWLTAENVCVRCEAAKSQVRNLHPDFINEVYAAGMHLETEPGFLPTGIENAVPGWKTLGSDQPVKADWPRNSQGYPVNPRYARLYGSGSRV